MKRIEFYRILKEGIKKDKGYLMTLDGLYYVIARTPSGKLWNVTEITTGLNVLSTPADTRLQAAAYMENHPRRAELPQVIQDAHKEDHNKKLNPFYIKLEELATAAGFIEALHDYRRGEISLEKFSEIAATGTAKRKLTTKPAHFIEKKEEPEKVQEKPEPKRESTEIKAQNKAIEELQNNYIKEAAAKMAASSEPVENKIDWLTIEQDGDNLILHGFIKNQEYTTAYIYKEDIERYKTDNAFISWIVEEITRRPCDEEAIENLKRKLKAVLKAKKHFDKIDALTAAGITIKMPKSAYSNYKKLAPFIETTRTIGHGAAKFYSGEYMPLTIEFCGYNGPFNHPVYSICHYGEQNGDLMRDPEMTIEYIKEIGAIIPLSYRNDYMGYYKEAFIYNDEGKATKYIRKELTGNDNFLRAWSNNIIEQGFAPETFESLA